MEKMKTSLEDISVERMIGLMPECSHIDNDIVLFNHFSEVPIPTDSRRMKCLLFALCTEGKASYTVDTKCRAVKKNDVIIVSEGQVIGDYMFNHGCDGLAIMMSYDFFRETISNVHELSQLFIFSRSHPVFTLQDNEAEVIMEYFEQIKRKVDEKEHHFRKHLVRSLIMSLIYDVSNVIFRIQQVKAPRMLRAETIFNDFIKLVEQNFRKERRVGWYAEQMCLNTKYLSETVKAVSNRRPNDWIDNYVTLELRVLLRNSSMSIKEITQQMHFANQSFLGKYFKEHVGVSPREYRNGG